MNTAEAEAILERAKSWPSHLKITLAEVAETLEAGLAQSGEIDDETRAAVDEGLAQADRGEFATDEEVDAAFATFRQ